MMSRSISNIYIYIFVAKLINSLIKSASTFFPVVFCLGFVYLLEFIVYLLNIFMPNQIK